MPVAAIIIGLVVLLFIGGSQPTVSTSSVNASSTGFSVSTQLGGKSQNTNASQSTNQTKTPTRTTTNTVSVAQTFLPPQLDTLSAWDLYSDRATVRTELTYVGEAYRGNLFLVASTDKTAISKIDSARVKFDDLSQTKNLLAFSISKGVKANGVYSKTIYQLNPETKYFYTTCFEATVVTCGGVETFVTNKSYTPGTTYQFPYVSSLRAESIKGTSVELSGSYRLNSAKNATAFFVYGTNRTLVNAIPTSYDTYSDVREAGDELQKVRTGVKINSVGSYEETVYGLKKSTAYYQRFCVAYDDDEFTEIRCGSVLSFTTKKKDYDIPTFGNQTAVAAGDAVSFSANVNMEDYNNGYLFLVYGAERDVTAVSERKTFTNVRPNGASLQRFAIDTDFDGSDTVQWFVKDVPSGDHKYRFCVQFEAENDYGRDEQQLSCSSVASFSIR